MLFSQYHLVRIASNNFISISYCKFLFNLITSFKINWYVLLLRKTISRQRNPLIVFLQDDARAGIQSLQTSIEIKLCQNSGDRLYFLSWLKSAWASRYTLSRWVKLSWQFIYSTKTANINNVPFSDVRIICNPYLAIKSTLNSLGPNMTKCRPHMNLTPKNEHYCHITACSGICFYSNNGKSGVSCNNFYSNPCSVKSVE